MTLTVTPQSDYATELLKHSADSLGKRQVVSVDEERQHSGATESLATDKLKSSVNVGLDTDPAESFLLLDMSIMPFDLSAANLPTQVAESALQNAAERELVDALVSFVIG